MKFNRGAYLISSLFFCVVCLTALFGFSVSSAQAASDHLLINEIYPSPLVGESEWVEIYNPTDSIIDLAEYTLEDGTAKPITLKNYSTINPKQFLVLQKSIDFSFALNNDGDTLLLKDKDRLIDQVTYGSDSAKNAPIPSTGKSITRGSTSTDTDQDFADFSLAQPTKGLAFFRPEYSTSVKITEILPNPIDGTENEFIELKNDSNAIIDLFNWTLSDGQTSYLFPHSILPPGQFSTVYHFQSRISLNDSYDKIILFDPNGDQKDAVEYSQAEKGQSFSLNGADWLWSQTPSPGADNIFSSSLSQENQLQTIAMAKDQESGQLLTVIGTVTVLPGILSKQYFYIQDQNSGIQVYCHAEIFPNLAVGNLVKVTGELSRAYGEMRLKISALSDIIILQSGELLEPKSLSVPEINSAEVGTLIETSGTVSKTSGDTFYLEDQEKIIKVTIREGTGIKKPAMKKGDRVEVSGILSSRNDELILLPIDQDDVKIISRGTLPLAGASLSPTIVISLGAIFLWSIYRRVKKTLMQLRPHWPIKPAVAIFLLWSAILVVAKLLLSKVLPKQLA